MNAASQAYTFLETHSPGLYQDTIATAIAGGGIIHITPRAVLIGIPAPNRPQRLLILFACGSMPSLWSLLGHCANHYTEASWQREFKGRSTWHTYNIHHLLTHRTDHHHA